MQTMTATLQRSIPRELEQIFAQSTHTFRRVLDFINTCAMLFNFDSFSFSVCGTLAQVKCTAENSFIFNNLLPRMHVIANLICIHAEAKVKFAKGKLYLFEFRSYARPRKKHSQKQHKNENVWELNAFTFSLFVFFLLKRALKNHSYYV